MRYKHPDVEKPPHTWYAQPTPTYYEDFETVTISASIYGTGTRIEQDMPTSVARQWAQEIIRACEIVETERRHAP